jgi:hypothetical protein
MAIVTSARNRLNTRTVYLNELNAAWTHQRPYRVRPYSTLNEKLGILHNTTSTVVYPSVKYFGVGVGGQGFRTGAGGVPETVYYQHDPSDAALFEQIPFVLRKLDNDLAPSQRERFALRKEITFNAVPYIAYYLRRINFTNVNYTTRYRNINAGSVTESVFETTSTNLSPTKNIPTTNSVNPTSGDYLVTSARIPLEFTAEDVDELLNVFMVMDGNYLRARLSEIAICSGIDHTIPVTASSGQFNFTDAISVQVMTFMAEDRALQFNTRGFTHEIDLGSNVPLLRLRT